MAKNRDSILEKEDKLMRLLDDLNLEETEELLSEINTVTLSPQEEASLKTKILEKCGIDGTKITNLQEAKDNEKEQNRKMVVTKTRKIKYVRKAVSLIAAFMICSILVMAATHSNGLLRYWGSDTDIYEGSSLEILKSVQNENIKMNIEGIIADKYQCVFVLSLEALTKDGRKILKEASNFKKHPEDPLRINIKPPFKNNLSGSTGIFQYTNDNRKNKDYKAYNCDFELENVDITKPAIVEFNGLSLKFDIPEPMETITLYPDSKGGFESVDISPIGYYYQSTQLAEDVCLIKKDGTLDETMGYGSGMSQEDNEKTWAIGSFTRLIDLKDYLGIKIDGINYTIK